MRLALWAEISTANLSQALTEFGVTSSPVIAKSPALEHDIFSTPLSASIFLNKPSAIGLRQVLPVHTNKTFITVVPLLSAKFKMQNAKCRVLKYCF